MPLLNPSKWHFNLDRYLNPVLPRPPWGWLPYPVAHFLGHRTLHDKRTPASLGNLIIIFWAAIGIFCGLVLVEVVSRQVPMFHEHGAPLIIGSFGAAAVLEFYAIESALAQPRNSIAGQLVASVVGVCICKLFALSPRFDDIRWLGGPLACALATAAMALTGTIHPPAGATALLAVADENIAAMGWYLIPVAMLGCALMLVVALLVNNIQRQYPLYWWTPEEVGHMWRRKRSKEENASEEELEGDEDEHAAKVESSTADIEARMSHVDGPRLTIMKDLVLVPEDMFLRPEEKMFLESLSQRL